MPVSTESALRFEPMTLLEEVTRLGLEQGLDRVGVAPASVLHRARAALHERGEAGLADGMQFTYRNPDRSTDPSRSVEGARSVVVAARSYLLDEPSAPDEPSARVARYAWVDHYQPLKRSLTVIARHLRGEGHRAVVFADDNAVVDREVAWLGGLGWFGKNANLLVPGAGSWFVLGCVVTTAELPLSEPVADGCGSCHRCLDACPTGAILAPGVVDARRCLAWQLQKPGVFPVEFRQSLGNRIYGCDDCQEVCPPTVRLGAKVTPPAVDPAEVEAWVPVLDLLAATDDELLVRHGRWYVAGRDPRWLRRNALVVMGNVADGWQQPVETTLRRYLVHDDPILRAHAVWAAARLGRTDLLPESDTDPTVAQELASLAGVEQRHRP